MSKIIRVLSTKRWASRFSQTQPVWTYSLHKMKKLLRLSLFPTLTQVKHLKWMMCLMPVLKVEPAKEPEDSDNDEDEEYDDETKMNTSSLVKIVTKSLKAAMQDVPE